MSSYDDDEFRWTNLGKLMVRKGDPLLTPLTLQMGISEFLEEGMFDLDGRATIDLTLELGRLLQGYQGSGLLVRWILKGTEQTAPPPTPAAPAAEVAKIVAVDSRPTEGPRRLPFPRPFDDKPQVGPRARWPGTYAEYLATARFREIANEARKDWGYRCLMSTSHRGPVEMHHRNYSDVPFHEDWHTLIPLCEECHERYHGRLPKPPPGLFDEHELKRAA